MFVVAVRTVTDAGVDPLQSSAAKTVGDLRLGFGVIAYLVMTWFVVPMSNAGNQQITIALPVTPVEVNGILIHMFGVGLPAAYFAARAIPAPRLLP